MSSTAVRPSVPSLRAALRLALLFAIRILSALAGAATVFLTGLLAWALGGLRPAQALAMLGVLVAPIYIAIDGFLSMNSLVIAVIASRPTRLRAPRLGRRAPLLLSDIRAPRPRSQSVMRRV